MPGVLALYFNTYSKKSMDAEYLVYSLCLQSQKLWRSKYSNKTCELQIYAERRKSVDLKWEEFLFLVLPSFAFLQHSCESLWFKLKESKIQFYVISDA